MDKVVAGDGLQRSTDRHLAQEEVSRRFDILDTVHRRIQGGRSIPVGREVVIAEDVAKPLGHPT